MSFEQIWAPWRLEYIVGDKRTELPDSQQSLEFLPGADKECFICQAAIAPDDRRRLTVWRGKHSLVVMNRYPYNNGHLLIAPLQHLARLDELSEEIQFELVQTLSRMVGLLEKVMSPEGFNIGLNLGRAAGAGVPGHLHWHIVPRWNGDTNFMPTTAGLNVIPQSLDALWGELTKELAKG